MCVLSPLWRPITVFPTHFRAPASLDVLASYRNSRELRNRACSNGKQLDGLRAWNSMGWHVCLPPMIALPASGCRASRYEPHVWQPFPRGPKPGMRCWGMRRDGFYCLPVRSSHIAPKVRDRIRGTVQLTRTPALDVRMPGDTRFWARREELHGIDGVQDGRGFRSNAWTRLAARRSLWRTCHNQDLEFPALKQLFRDTYRYRQLIWALAMKELKVRYKRWSWVFCGRC